MKIRSLYKYNSISTVPQEIINQLFMFFRIKKTKIETHKNYKDLKLKTTSNSEDCREFQLSGLLNWKNYDFNEETCEWDIDFFKNFEFTKPKFLTFGVMDNKDQELYRKDFTIESEPQYVNLENNKYSFELDSIEKPKKIVMFLFDEDKLWSNRYEKVL
jgi:hypothetical protein